MVQTVNPRTKATRLAKVLANQGRPVAWLARALGTRYTYMHVYSVVKGWHGGSVAFYQAAAQALSTSVDEIVGEEEAA